MYTTHNELMTTLSKTLGQTEAKFLADLASQDKQVFTTEDARVVAGTSEHAVDLLIASLALVSAPCHRLVK